MARQAGKNGTDYTHFGVNAQVDHVLCSIREELDVINFAQSKRTALLPKIRNTKTMG